MSHSAAGKEIIEGLQELINGGVHTHSLLCRRCKGKGRAQPRNKKSKYWSTCFSNGPKCKTCKGKGRIVFQA
jgi:DnaJ-class molecular chaperone